MPEKKGYLWDPMYGILPDVDPVYYDDSLTEPAVVSAPLPAKFNGSQEAARRYAEGYRWGRENVRDPREQVAPYVGAGLAATMLAPYAISAAATGVTNPWAMQFGKRMLLDLPTFEVMDRLPTLIGQDRATVQAGNLAERGFRALTPDGAFEENVAPYVNQAGQFVGGFVPGMLGDAAMRGGVSLVNRIGKSIASDRAGYFEPIAEMMQERPIEAVVNPTQNRTIPRGTDFDVDAAAFRYDQTGIETPIITGPGGNVTEARIPGDVRRRVLADHPEMVEELAALQNNPAEMQRAMQEMAAMTPEQIAETQAILTDVAKGNRAVKETLLHEAPKPIVEAPLANGYSIERYPGYQLKMLMAGNPLEKQIGKNGTVNINNINALKQKASKVEQAVIDKVLASEEFAGKKAIDYNKFRKAVQDELITYERTPDTRWKDYGMNRIGVSPFDPDLESDYEYYRLLNKFIKEKGYTPVYNQAGIDSVVYKTPDGKYIGEKELEDIFRNSFSNVKASTFTFSSSRIPKGNAKHYDANTLGHSRTYTTADEPDVLHVMESQSDWAQAGKDSNRKSGVNSLSRSEIESNINSLRRNIERDEAILAEGIGRNGAPMTGGERFGLDQTIGVEKEQLESFEQWLRDIDSAPTKSSSQILQEDYLIDNYTSRQIQENLRYAAEKGQKKMRYPTRETAAKIEGYPEQIRWYDKNGFEVKDPYEYPEDVARQIEEVQNEIDKIDLVDLDAYAPFTVREGSFEWGTRRGEEYNAKLLAKLRDRILKDRDSIAQMRAHGDENSMVEARLAENEKLFDMQLARYEKTYGKTPALDKILSESRAAKARRPVLESKRSDLLGSGPTQLKKGLTEKRTYQYEDILKRYTAFPKQYQKLFKGADVRTVTDLKGNTWYEVDVPENYLQQEWAYKSGGLLNRLRSHYGSNDKIREAIKMAKGGKIHIDPSKKGTFTAAATKHGKSVQAFASQVLENKENYSPAMVKKANFARNASRWKALGGNIDGDDDFVGPPAPDYLKWSEGFTRNFNDLPSSKKKDVIAVASGYGVDKNDVAEWYNSPDGRRMLGARFRGIPIGGRQRHNTSKTQEESEKLTSKMHERIVLGDYDSSIPTSGTGPSVYDIPYIYDKEISIPAMGGRFPLNVVDSVAKYANLAGISLQEGLGLIAQETSGGALPLFNYEKLDGKTGADLERAEAFNTALGNSNYFREYGSIPAERLVRDFEYNRVGHEIDRSVPPLLHAFKYYKDGRYNTGDPNHTRDVLEKGRKLLGDKRLLEYIRKSKEAKNVKQYK